MHTGPLRAPTADMSNKKGFQMSLSSNVLSSEKIFMCFQFYAAGPK